MLANSKKGMEMTLVVGPALFVEKKGGVARPDWVIFSCPETTQIRAGVCVFVCRTKLNQLVSCSGIEVEYWALANATTEAKWLF